MSLDDVLSDPRIFRPRRASGEGDAVVPSGFRELDARLPGGGWPRGALSEFLSDEWGVGELRLLMPALSRLTQAGRWVVWVSPPYLPYAPALAGGGLDPGRCIITRPGTREERIWTVEQALRSGACGAVLGWRCEGAARHVRRLQLAAESGDALALMFRPLKAARQRSPAALRVALAGGAEGVTLKLIKARGMVNGEVRIRW